MEETIPRKQIKISEQFYGSFTSSSIRKIQNVRKININNNKNQNNE